MKKYIIECNEDNSFNVVCNEISIKDNIETETKDMLSFCLQYLYTLLNSDEMMLSKSAKEKVTSVIESFNFNPNDVKELSGLISKLGYNLNQVLMTYDNGIPKNWDDLE